MLILHTAWDIQLVEIKIFLYNTDKMALPPGLKTRDQVMGLAGVESSRISLLPTNTSGSYKENEMVTFGIPSYRFSSINTARTYLKFKIRAIGADKSRAVFAGASQVFNRLVVKNDSGVHLESIDRYHTFSRMMDNLKSKAQLEGEASMSKDWRVLKEQRELPDKSDYSTYTTVIHDLKSGILGNAQKFLVNLDIMRASSGASYTVELYLSSALTVFPETRGGMDIQYEITDVSLELELLKIPEGEQERLNSALVSSNDGSMLPFTTYTMDRRDVPDSTACNLQIASHQKDVTAIYSILSKKSKVRKVISQDLKNVFGEGDHQRFLGGRFTIVDGLATTSDTVVSQYNFRYANRSFPLSPVNMNEDSTLALANAITTFEMKDKMPYLADTLCTTDYKFIGHFETSMFLLAQNFRSVQDTRILSGLNLSSVGAPLEINIQFKNTVSDIECISFLEFSETLYIGAGGLSTLNKPM